VRRCLSWSPDPSAGTIPIDRMARFALPILLSEVFAAARVNLDKLLVWSSLGVDALGIYYFAFNAGIGLSLSLTMALSNSLYPELARYASQPALMLKRFDQAILKTALPISGIILLQAALSLFYVPLVFGEKWQHASAVVALLCLSAVSKPFSDAGTQLLRACGLPLIELGSVVLLTIVTLTALWTGLGYGLMAGVIAFAATSFACQVAVSFFARRLALGSPSNAFNVQPLTS
jgi:O-antigen/teichoic acid export membrane protein